MNSFHLQLTYFFPWYDDAPAPLIQARIIYLTRESCFLVPAEREKQSNMLAYEEPAYRFLFFLF